MSSDHVSTSASEHDGNAGQPEPSIDSIIAWLRRQRSQWPTAPLSKLLKGVSLSADRLLDLSCIDLIGQRRAGHPVVVEDYLRDFGELREDAKRLDLIDAEICVDRELGKLPCLEELASRFSDLRSQIGDLLEMDPIGHDDLALIGQSFRDRPRTTSVQQTGGLDPPASESAPQESLDRGRALTPLAESAAGGESMEFSIAATSGVRTGAASGASLPLDVPRWFVGPQCVASGPGHWLIRGRDAARGETLAMKVIELPLPITNRQVDQLMDACEQAAKVRHPCWVSPAVAAVQNRHLAVIRPWVFANPWQSFARAENPARRLRQLAQVAYALQSAHAVGAAHGGIHPSNLLIDHDGKVQIVDVTSAMVIVARWLEVDHGFACLARRQSWDVQDMIKLVVTDVVEWSGAWADGWIPQLRRIADQHRDEASGRIGDALTRLADEQQSNPCKATLSATERPSLRRRLAKWISHSLR